MEGYLAMTFLFAFRWCFLIDSSCTDNNVPSSFACIAFMIEVSFGAWAGWRGYSIVSSQNNDSFEAIAQIPLCAGRR